MYMYRTGIPAMHIMQDRKMMHDITGTAVKVHVPREEFPFIAAMATTKKKVRCLNYNAHLSIV